MTDSKPDYARHEGVYASLRAKGAIGWSSEEEYQVMKDLVVPLLPPATGGLCLLELGSGAGNLSLALAGMGYAVTGVEISPTAVSWAQERAALAGVTANFRVDNVVDLATCESESVDVVIDGHCLHCIVGSDRARCFASIRRVLKSGGILIVLTMCGEVLDGQLLEAFDPATRTVAFGGRPSRHIGTAESITAEVLQSGLRIDLVKVHSRRLATEQEDLLLKATRSST